MTKNQRNLTRGIMKANDFLSLVKARQSVRGYLPSPVERDKLERCLEAARLAPSACNAQPWTFIVVDNAGIKDQLADLTADRWLPLNHWTKHHWEQTQPFQDNSYHQACCGELRATYRNWRSRAKPRS